MKMSRKIGLVAFEQWETNRYAQIIKIYRHYGSNLGSHTYLASTPTRFARFMAIVIAFAARHDEDRRHDN